MGAGPVFFMEMVQVVLELECLSGTQVYVKNENHLFMRMIVKA